MDRYAMPKSHWKSCGSELPPFEDLVFVMNPKKTWMALGCRVITSSPDEEISWCWAVAFDCNSLYIEDGKIKAECEIDDWDIAYWHELPALLFGEKEEE